MREDLRCFYFFIFEVIFYCFILIFFGGGLFLVCFCFFQTLTFLGFFGVVGYTVLFLKGTSKVNKVTTEQQKWPNIGQNCVKSPFLAQRVNKSLTEGQSPPKRLDIGLCSVSYHLVPLEKIFM